ncbi:MAG: glutathione S-transferase [Pseudomonadales bacterium]|nr:glutathione S-transferase [Pseudomonadales bacterium]
MPILYSFRRCPYAIRARMALRYAKQIVELREVVLKNKPAAMLQASAKGTVPVLVLPGGQVLEQSLDIMLWAVTQSDPEHWQLGSDTQRALIETNDTRFKRQLDRYKYADRHPQHPASFYRAQACTFLSYLNKQLEQQPFLQGQRAGLADIAIFPFVRQFAFVDPDWFAQCSYSALRGWLQQHLGSALFTGVMQKYPAWQPGANPLLF